MPQSLSANILKPSSGYSEWIVGKINILENNVKKSTVKLMVYRNTEHCLIYSFHTQILNTNKKLAVP